ncbi:hypothetical protein IPF37_05555 [bacterium]|nr:MAG: hypothetical protein IPF37_05555 [bacterium]
MWGTYKDTNATHLYHYTNGAWSKVKDQAGQDVTSFTQIALSGNTIFALKADGSVVKYGMGDVSPELINQVVADIQQQQVEAQALQDKKTDIKKGLKKKHKKLAAQKKKRSAKSAKKKNAAAPRTPAQRRVIRTAGKAQKAGKKKSHKKAKAVSVDTVDSTDDAEAATR